MRIFFALLDSDDNPDQKKSLPALIAQEWIGKSMTPFEVSSKAEWFVAMRDELGRRAAAMHGEPEDEPEKGCTGSEIRPGRFRKTK